MNYIDERSKNFDLLKNLGDACPEIMKSFMNLHGEFSKESAISLKEKEMVAIGIAISTQCEPCMISHITVFKQVGGNREELIDVIKTCILMNGGPGIAYGSKALRMFDELS